MCPAKHYGKFHSRVLDTLERKLLTSTDKYIFAFLFNFRSWILRNDTRLSWSGEYFIATDKKLPWFRYRIRSQGVCNYSYKYGVHSRVDYLARCYFLDQMNFADGDTFFDCGANVGDVKLWFKIRGLDVNYIGFEPSPIEYKCLKHNVSPSEVHNIGLWNDGGKIEFYVSSKGADSSIIEPKQWEKKIIVNADRLEKYISQPIKCLKIEAEGAEPEIIEGIGDKLTHVEYISADLGFERGVEEESTLLPVIKHLSNNGFELIDLSINPRICALFRNRSL